MIVFNEAGICLQSTFNPSESIPAIGLFDDLLFRARRAIKLFNRLDDLESMRIKTLKFEILITKDSNDLIFVVFQNVVGKVAAYAC